MRYSKRSYTKQMIYYKQDKRNAIILSEKNTLCVKDTYHYAVVKQAEIKVFLKTCFQSFSEFIDTF